MLGHGRKEGQKCCGQGQKFLRVVDEEQVRSKIQLRARVRVRVRVHVRVRVRVRVNSPFETLSVVTVTPRLQYPPVIAFPRVMISGVTPP